MNVLYYLFLLVIFLHGLIHLMGFAKAFGYGENIPISREVSKLSGIIWLATAGLFIIVSLLVLLKKEWWWFGFSAILVSQALIFLYWKDAKWGTIANIIILLVVIPSYAESRFNDQYKKEAKQLLSEAASPGSCMITHEMISHLPLPVQRWLERSKVIGKEMIQTAFIHQVGEMMTKPGGKWMPFEAEQYSITQPVSFIWKTRVAASSFMSINGWDKYIDGKGHMQIKLCGLFTIANAQGKETDQGSMLRYLGEVCWFPSAALKDYIKWEAVDSLSAKATMHYSGDIASGIFHFSTDGDMISFEADRYYVEGSKKPSLEKWVVTTVPGAYKEFGGIRIPYRSEVTWKPESGDYTWLKLELTDVKYNTE